MTREEDEARADAFFAFDDEEVESMEQAADVGAPPYPFPPPFAPYPAAPRAAKVMPLEPPTPRMCPACSYEIDSSSRFCPRCGAACEAQSEGQVAELSRRIALLESQVNRLSGAVNQHADVVNTDLTAVPALPRTNLLSPNFWTRAWAVYGHALAIGMLFAIPLWLFAIFAQVAIVASLRR